MKRKEEILLVALKLFNGDGIQDVTTREIANELNISVGNLTYHFPTKEDIVNTLWQQYEERRNMAIRNLVDARNKDPLTATYLTTEAVFKVMVEYQFIFSRGFTIHSPLHTLRKTYQDDFVVRFQNSSNHYKKLIKAGYLKKTLLEDLNGFIYTSNILGAFWQQDIFMFFPQLSDKQKIAHGLAIFFQPFKPYLTKKGAEILNPLLKNLRAYRAS